MEDAEIPRIAAFLGLSETAFIEQFTRLRTNRQGLSLLEHENHECIMLEGDSCRIHPVKPTQCAGFPNRWNFPGWRDLCQALPLQTSNPATADFPAAGQVHDGAQEIPGSGGY